MKYLNTNNKYYLFLKFRKFYNSFGLKTLKKLLKPFLNKIFFGLSINLRPLLN